VRFFYHDGLVLVRLGKLFVVFALAATLGAHWALLQTVAWTTMLANNLQSASMSEAMAKTFDGQHPCSLCKAIAAGKKTEQKNQLMVEKQKLEFPPLQNDFTLIAPSRMDLVPRENSFAKSFFPEPATPPPRAFFI
jgi:hypothetical protein